MKILIGITQNPHEADKNICQEFKMAGAQTVVGPFMSSIDASKWMEFMMARAEDYEQLTLPANSSGDDIWYGISFETTEAQTH